MPGPRRNHNPNAKPPRVYPPKPWWHGKEGAAKVAAEFGLSCINCRTDQPESGWEKAYTYGEKRWVMCRACERERHSEMMKRKRARERELMEAALAGEPVE